MNGSLDRYQTRSGETRWRIRWDDSTDSEGARRRRSRAGFRTRSEAKAALHEVQQKQTLGVSTAPDRETLREYLPRWLEGLRVKPTTLANYSTSVNRYLIPMLGGVRLHELQPDHLDALYRQLERDGKGGGVGLAPKTVRHVHTAVRKALQDAVDRGRLARNVADLAHPPTQRQSRSQNARVKAWTVDELGTFLATVRDDRLAALWVLIASTGLRRGEAVGLRWDAVDLTEGSVSVHRTVTEAAGRIVASDSAKTASSQRRIAIDSATATALRNHKRRQAEERLRLGALWPADGQSVFTRPDGLPLRPSDVSHVFTRTVRALGLPEVGVHGLRHTYATLAIRAGIPAHVISKRLGHSSVGITMDVYAHAFPSDDRDAAERVAAVLFG